MSRKLKVIPFDSTNLTKHSNGQTANQSPSEIIPPVSWELNTATNVLQESGVLGNVVTHTTPFQERSYSFNWVGNRKDINKVLNCFIRTSNRHFILGGLSNHNVVSPGILFNSRGMLASVADKYKFPGEIYNTYLNVFHGSGHNVGSIGVKVEEGSSNFTHVDTSDSAEAYLFIPRNTEYSMSLNPVRYGYATPSQNNLHFHATYYSLNNSIGAPTTETIRLVEYTEVFDIPTSGVDRVMKLSLIIPNVTSTATGIRGVLNYIPPIIRLKGTSTNMDDYEDIPSILRPVDNYIYNIISPNIAELSINFMEIARATE